MTGDASLTGSPVAGSVAVNDKIAIPIGELTIRATRSGGAGGQHVNKSSTRIEVVWNVRRTRALTAEERDRVESRLAARIDSEGDLRVVASDTRSQAQNRALAVARLAGMVRRALLVQKARRPTRPTRASVERRLSDKQRRAERKRGRQRPPID